MTPREQVQRIKRQTEQVRRVRSAFADPDGDYARELRMLDDGGRGPIVTRVISGPYEFKIRTEEIEI